MDSTPAAAPPTTSRPARSVLLGAVLLLASSSIGPGLITQTATSTAWLGAAFACAIAISLLVDVAVQTNMWRVIGVSGRRAQEPGKDILLDVGRVLALLVVSGDVVVDIGNVAGRGLGTQATLDVEPRVGGAVPAAAAATCCRTTVTRAGFSGSGCRRGC